MEFPQRQASPSPQEVYEYVLTVDRLGDSQRRSPRFSSGTPRSESAPTAFWIAWLGKLRIRNISLQTGVTVSQEDTHIPTMLHLKMMLQMKDVSLRNTAAI